MDVSVKNLKELTKELLEKSAERTETSHAKIKDTPKLFLILNKRCFIWEEQLIPWKTVNHRLCEAHKNHFIAGKLDVLKIGEHSKNSETQRRHTKMPIPNLQETSSFC